VQEHHISDSVKKLMTTLIAAIVIGIGSSFASTYVWVNVLDERVSNVKEDVSDIGDALKQINVNQIEIQVQLKNYSNQIRNLGADRYTATDARQANGLLQSQIDKIKSDVQQIKNTLNERDR
jgi:conjugal transfer/entry exclusion protein